MIESIFVWESARTRHLKAPLLKEREEYLSHLVRLGNCHGSLRSAASILLHIIRLMEISNPRKVDMVEINNAAERWAQDEQFHRRKKAGESTAYRFSNAAESWFRFNGLLIEQVVTRQPFDALMTDFNNYLRFTKRSATDTIRTYTQRVSKFLSWVADRYDHFSSVSLLDIDDFIESKRTAGWRPRTIAGLCQALRTFFRYAEFQRLCAQGIARGIRSPIVPKYEEAPRGPLWRDVRRLLKATTTINYVELRARAILSLCAIYGLRSSEIAGLCLSDFDWYNETLTVRRAKRGRVQQFPIQYEVGEAILQYLKNARPHCSCRNLFVTRRLPYRPIHSSSLWPIVASRMRALGIKSEHVGPHALRHACATQLLKKGSALRDIADFLGHRDIKSVSIYAKYDTRSLRKVAAFSLAGVRWLFLKESSYTSNGSAWKGSLMRGPRDIFSDFVGTSAMCSSAAWHPNMSWGFLTVRGHPLSPGDISTVF